MATLDGTIPGYASPESPTPSMTVPATWYGYPSKPPVITSEGDWLSVHLAQRPNGRHAQRHHQLSRRRHGGVARDDPGRVTSLPPPGSAR